MPAPYQSLSPSLPSSPPSRTLSPSSPRALSPTSSLRALEFSGAESPSIGRPSRSDTVTSLGGFEFQHALLPLTLSGEGADGADAHKGEEKHVGLLHGVALIVGTQVGSGIFSSPGVVVAEVGSVGASLLVWVASGILAWTGAASFAELGCAIPLSGGPQAYLAYSFGPMVAYLYTWTAVSVIKPGSSAIISLIFGEYVNRMIYHATTGDPEAIVPEWTFKITATIAIILVSILNLVSQTMGPNSSVVITTVKTGSLIFVAVLGIVWFATHGGGPSLAPSSLFEGTSTSPGSYALALYSGLWAFDGWDACCYVAGEMKDTTRDLPRAIYTSMTTVLILFVAANLSYFVVLDPSVVASSNTVALDFGRVIMGRLGAVLFSTLVAISCFGALLNAFYTTARLIYAASRDHFLPEIFSRLNHRRRTPDNAMALQAGMTTLFVVFGGGFRTLLNFFSVTAWTFFLTTVLGLLVLRVKEPHLERPYRVWLITPITFCLVASFLLLMPIFAAPLEALIAFLFISTGVPMYYLTARSRSRSVSAHPDREGIKATLAAAWSQFRDDVLRLLPSSWTVHYKPSSDRPLDRVEATGEETMGMLRGDHVEMRER
ncbi:putative L-methionine porter [Naematelia encephala]|uniref:Putative L-methionine porter n=1 Tax=Naematelia encephala TaxID=71784 RepID=A0A1Y2B0M6_9TREE|nr:putative L-methionine porter [Naematelia encephala]